MFLAEREGFLLWQATSSITNPHSGVLIPSNAKKEALSFLFLAEREGFEPPVPLSTSVFKTGAIDHSATSPKVFCVKECGLSVFDVAKVYQKSEPCKRLTEKFENNFIFTSFTLFPSSAFNVL